MSKFFSRTKKLSCRQILLIILLFAALARFINYPSRWVFLQDQARELIVARESISQKTLPSLGPKASPGFFAPAPYWYWYVILTQLMWRTITSPTFGVTLSSLLTIALIFMTSQKITHEIGLSIIAGLFAAFSPELIKFSTTATNPSFIPLFTAAAIYFALSWIQEKRPSSLFLVAFFVSLSSAFHLQGLATVSILILAILFAFPKNFSAWLTVFIGILLPIFPLIAFDFKHNWYNTHNLYQYFFHTQRAFFDRLTWPVYFSRFWPEIFASAVGGFLLIGLIFFILSFLYVGLSVFKKRKEELFIFAIFLADFFGLRYYKADKIDSYLVFILPIVILLVSLICWWIFKRINYLGILIFIILLTCNTLTIIHQMAKGNNLGKMITVKEKLAQMGEKVALYHYPENWNVSLPLLVLLEEEKKLNSQGTKLGVCEVFSEKIIEQGIRKACPEKEALVTIDNIKIYKLKAEDLGDSSWQEVSWSKVYQDSVFWWKM